MEFSKIHGLGNDFILVDDRREELADCPRLAREICHRHFGVGADGLILVQPSRVADFKMRIFNADGSEAEMCGNGIRCFAKFVYERGMTGKTRFTVETPAGIMVPQCRVKEGRVTMVTVDMGEPRLAARDIPLAEGGGEPVVDRPLEAAGQIFRITTVSMGNPHCVIPVEDVAGIRLEEVGPQIERHPLFPRKTNVEFVQFLSPTRARVRVWERGAGATLACGTGACAVAVAGHLLGKTERRLTVTLPGGDLAIEWAEDNHLYMTGPAAEVFRGVYLARRA